MKLHQLPDHFWTDTELDAVERQRINKHSEQFRTRVNSRNEPHQFYALTVSARESYVRNHLEWTNMDSRERFIEGLFSLLIHHVSSKCCPNYRREIHKDRRIISLGFIEHYSRETKELVSPHIHATLAVHDQWVERFENCFLRNFCRDHYSLQPNLLPGSASARWDQQVAGIRLKHLPTSADQFRWIGYSSKQIDDNNGIGLTFLHQGVSRKSRTPTYIRQGMTA